MTGLVLGAIFSVVAAAPAPDEVHRSVRAELTSDYQTELPGEERIAPQAGKPRRAASRSPRRMVRRQPAQRSSGGAFGSVASALLWMLVIVVFTVLAMWAIQEFGGFAGDPMVADADPEQAQRDTRRRVVDKPLGDAEQLARHGEFAAAIHTLLLRTLQELARTSPTGLPRSFTSREILARVSMPQAAREALSELVIAVELCHFGGESLGAAEYHACRDHFHRFAHAYMAGEPTARAGAVPA